ncbi:hypothetical protein B0H14DRAFT_2650292 [Mycena olivaceomarginata]|nr:hypothetical protein B0H14DRAFT_2650292 [Mycena olivaceomarginata]
MNEPTRPHTVSSAAPYRQILFTDGDMAVSTVFEYFGESKPSQFVFELAKLYQRRTDVEVDAERRWHTCMRHKQVRPSRHGRWRLLVPLPVLPKIAFIYNCHLLIFPPSSSSSSSTHASSSLSSSSSPSSPSTEMSSGSSTRIGHGIVVCVINAEGAEERENGNSPFTGLRLFPLVNLGFPPDFGDVCTGAQGNNMLLTMGNIPGGIGGERVLTYGGVGIGADAYRCGDTGKTMRGVGGRGDMQPASACRWCHLPEGCKLHVGEDGTPRGRVQRVAAVTPARSTGGSTNVKGRCAAGAGARAGGLGPASVSVGAGRVCARPTVAARRGKRTVEEGERQLESTGRDEVQKELAMVVVDQ